MSRSHLMVLSLTSAGSSQSACDHSLPFTVCFFMQMFFLLLLRGRDSRCRCYCLLLWLCFWFYGKTRRANKVSSAHCFLTWEFSLRSVWTWFNYVSLIGKYFAERALTSYDFAAQLSSSDMHFFGYPQRLALRMLKGCGSVRLVGIRFFGNISFRVRPDGNAQRM